MQRRVVFILSTNYAGSHLLAQLVGAHTRCLSIGELHNYAKLRDRARDDRNVVSDYGHNPIFEGLGSHPETTWHARIFENARRYRPAVSTLIDNSKRIDWARRCSASNDFEPAYVHLIRDPRALVRRWQRSYATRAARFAQRRRLARRRPRWLLQAWTARTEIVYALKWLFVNEAISSYCGDRAIVITYEELVCDPVTTLQSVMPQLGLDYEPAQLAYGRAAHAGTLKRDYLGATARSAVVPDARWREQLDADVRLRIARLPALVAYLDALGLELTPDTLRRSGGGSGPHARLEPVRGPIRGPVREPIRGPNRG